MTDEEIIESKRKLGIANYSLDEALNPAPKDFGPILHEDENAPIPASKLQLDQDAVNNLLSNDFGFLTGLAGTGKSTLITEVCRLNPHEFELCATTGIAGINLGTKTLHSTLKFFDTRSLGLAFDSGLLQMNLRKVRARVKKLFIDEVSMLGAEPFDIIMNAIDEINSDNSGRKLGMWVSGDMAQLPPIKEKYVFRADYWSPRFSDNTIRLTKVWRQTNQDFLDGINLIRASRGVEAMKLLQKAGVNFINQVDDHFDGTTLIAKNEGVDIYNTKRLNELTTPLIRVTVITAGAQHKEWQRMIPFELRLKVGALVMILANDVPAFTYCNGDLGTVESYDITSETFQIKLKRNDKTVTIKRIERLNLEDNEPVPTGRFQPYHDFKSNQWVAGWIKYFPLRLAWASTIHKCLHEDTIVREERRGCIPIKYIIAGDRIWNGYYFVEVKTTVKSKQLAIDVVTDRYKITCSPEHKFPVLWDNNLTKEAKSFIIGQQLLDGNCPTSSGYVIIKELKEWPFKADMIDLELEETNDILSNIFWANGILTHNSQGLSLDKVQIDTRGQFFGYNSMGYVSLSRARTPSGLYLVGTPAQIGQKISMSPEVREYV